MRCVRPMAKGKDRPIGVIRIFSLWSVTPFLMLCVVVVLAGELVQVDCDLVAGHSEKLQKTQMELFGAGLGFLECEKDLQGVVSRENDRLMV